MNLKNIKIGEIIKSYRLKNNLTQEELSVLLNFDSPQFISNIERGIAKIPLNVLGKLIQILQLPEDQIIDLLTTDFKSNLVTEISRIKKTRLK